MGSQKLRVLHLEDDPLDRELVADALAAEGFPCDLRWVADRAGFEAALEQPLDLVLSDFTLPRFDGLAALALARARRPEVPFVLVSGTVGEEVAIESVKSGATDYVLKHRLLRLGPSVRRALAEAAERRLRQEAEEALRRERHFLKAVLDSLDSGVMACDREGTLTLLNRAGRGIHGQGEARVRAVEVSERYGYCDPQKRTPLPAEATPLIRAFAGEEVRGMELLIRGPGGEERDVVASGQPVLDEEGRNLGAVVSMTDVTEQRQLERQLRQAQRMEVLGLFAGGIAHDFNNLLTVILGYGQAVLSRLPEADPLHAKVEQIHRAATRGTALTRQLLAFSRNQPVHAVVLDLHVLLKDMQEMLSRILGSAVVQETELAASSAWITADPSQVEQIVMNLAVNARDAMPEGGCLSIRTRNATLDEKAVRGHLGARPGRFVALSVTDTGMGMPREVAARVFEPFFTTKEPGKGTGLGLSTVFAIVKRAGGHIELTTKPGEGTTFQIFLPEAARPAEPPQEGSRAVGAVDGRA